MYLKINKLNYTMMENQMQRREFLRKAAMLTAGAVVLAGTIHAGSLSEETYPSGNPLLNPAFRIRELSNGEIELYTFLKDKSKLSEIFAGFDADVIRSISEGKDLVKENSELAFRYNLTAKKCRKKTDNLLNDLQKSGIIYYGELMLVKIQEG
jgi:hypothetical protein